MKKNLLYLLVLHVVGLVAAPSIVHAELITTWVTPAQSVQAGASFEVVVMTANRGDTGQTVENPPTLSGTVTLAGRTWPVELRASSEPEFTVVPNGFVLQSYTVTLPSGISGQGVLRVEHPGTGALNGMIDITGETSSQVDQPTPSAGPRHNTLRADEADTALGRTFAGRLNVHNPIYFICGSGDHSAKFQLSFKYRLATFSENKENGTISTLQFGYTQRSLWDLGSDSYPFYDTSYMPEVFWELDKLPEQGETDRISWRGLQSGVHHESNGRDGPESRSLNSAFLRAAFTMGPNDGWNLKLFPEARIYVLADKDEPIEDSRGNTELAGILSKGDSIALRFCLTPGKNFDHPTCQLDLTMPVHVPLFDLAAFLHLQYFNGYGESLLAYDQQSDAIRVGLSFVR